MWCAGFTLLAVPECNPGSAEGTDPARLCGHILLLEVELINNALRHAQVLIGRLRCRLMTTTGAGSTHQEYVSSSKRRAHKVSVIVQNCKAVKSMDWTLTHTDEAVVAPR